MAKRSLLTLSRFVGCVFVISSLSACNVLAPVNIETPNKYVLKKTPEVKKHHRRHGILLVAPVTADPIYDRIQMAYSKSPYELAYFAKSEWASVPSKMLQKLLITTLIDTHHFRGVMTSPTYAQYDYILNVQLLEMKQVFASNHSYYKVKLHAELVNAKRSNLIAEKTVAIAIRAKEANPVSGVKAANKATSIALKQLSTWCVEKTS